MKSIANVVKLAVFFFPEEPHPCLRTHGRMIRLRWEVHALCGKPSDRSNIWVSELPVCHSERLPGRARLLFAPLASHANLPVSLRRHQQTLYDFSPSEPLCSSRPLLSKLPSPPFFYSKHISDCAKMLTR